MFRRGSSLTSETIEVDLQPDPATLALQDLNGGRVAVLARGDDRPNLINAPLRVELKSKIGPQFATHQSNYIPKPRFPKVKSFNSNKSDLWKAQAVLPKGNPKPSA